MLSYHLKIMVYAIYEMLTVKVAISRITYLAFARGEQATVIKICLEKSLWLSQQSVDRKHKRRQSSRKRKREREREKERRRKHLRMAATSTGFPTALRSHLVSNNHLAYLNAASRADLVKLSQLFEAAPLSSKRRMKFAERWKFRKGVAIYLRAKWTRSGW